MRGTFYLSVINYPWDHPICTQWCANYYDAVNNRWEFTPWAYIANASLITCELTHIALIAWVGNTDPNDPDSPKRFPAQDSFEVNGPYAPIQHTVVDGGHYRLNLNARTGQSGKMVFEGGDWIPGPRPGQTSKTGLLIGAAIFSVGAIAVILSIRRE